MTNERFFVNRLAAQAAATNTEENEEMSESKIENAGKKVINWIGWVKNAVSAVAGAVISCAATIGVIGKSDADAAKARIESALAKTEIVQEKFNAVTEAVAKVKALLGEKKYDEAVQAISEVKEAADEGVAAVNDLKEGIESEEAVKEEPAAEEPAEGQAEETVPEAPALDEVPEAPALEAAPADEASNGAVL